MTSLLTKREGKKKADLAKAGDWETVRNSEMISTEPETGPSVRGAMSYLPAMLLHGAHTGVCSTLPHYFPA